MDIELHFFQDDDANTCKDKIFFYQAGCDLDAPQVCISVI